MRELGVEMIIVMAYGHMLKKNILDYGEYPCINLHASLLPQLRGASPVETAVALGMEKTGVSLMRIEERMDAGAVCAKIEVEISREECAVGLRKKIAAAAIKGKHFIHCRKDGGLCRPRRVSGDLHAQDLQGGLFFGFQAGRR